MMNRRRRSRRNIVATVALVMLGVCGAARSQADPIEVFYVGSEPYPQTTTAVLAADTWYMATVRGTISYERDRHMLYADALYLTDESTNRSTKQKNLYFDPPAELVASNPAKHEFLFRFHGTGKRLSALFFGWQRAQLRVDARADILGSLEIDLTEAAPPSSEASSDASLAAPLPSASVPMVADSDEASVTAWGGAVGPWSLVLFGFVGLVLSGRGIQSFANRRVERARREELERQEAAQRREVQEARRHLAARRLDEEDRYEHEARVRRGMEKVCAAFEMYPLYEDDTYIQNYAAKHTYELLRDRQLIEKRYRELHANPEVVALLKRERPDIYKRALFEMTAYNLAARLDVTPPPPPSPPPAPPPPKREPSARELRERSIQKERNRCDEVIAKKRVQLDAVVSAQEMIKTFRLRREERNRHEQDIREELLSGQESGKSI